MLNIVVDFYKKTFSAKNPTQRLLWIVTFGAKMKSLLTWRKTFWRGIFLKARLKRLF